VPGLPPNEDSERWRKRAEEMRTLAEDMHDPLTRRTMRRIAADYDRLVEWAESGSARPKPLPSTTERTTRPN
jgi:hypothetical protein